MTKMKISLIYYHQTKGKQIHDKISLSHQNSISYGTVLSILDNIHYCFADYLKNKYRLHQIGGDPSLEKIVLIDESLFLHENAGRQIWVVGAIDTENKNIRLDKINERTQNNLKTFDTNHIAPGTHLTHDGWPSYTFFLFGRFHLYPRRTQSCAR
jgi:hypothetical protein